MNLNNYYWYFKSVIPPRICDDIVKYALSKEQTVARIGGYEDKKLSKQDIKNIQNYRKSDITWLDDTWIYKEVHPYIHEANKLAGWNFQWDFSEPCQFTKYKHNQYYDWHYDSMDKVYDEKHGDLQKGKIRKLSMTCQLTDGSEYEGGELEFDYRNYEPL
jgi:PKHD-type hydroxylase